MFYFGWNDIELHKSYNIILKYTNITTDANLEPSFLKDIANIATLLM